ncbi:hypothetical protein Vretimale_4808 [Volvox reticuliferus]|uniref:Uncharacterized protein n=1 Tax=Volvox reticuliferus TaxID=1737510 RepID=A0A8J4G539_9CHLO|nr:hypothetical protein Vretifemale_4186 [Volvox reticuliferus]GIL99841.1 hypothetical protein Vretimale_4808 [Volvox reticuliferus]
MAAPHTRARSVSEARLSASAAAAAGSSSVATSTTPAGPHDGLLPAELQGLPLPGLLKGLGNKDEEGEPPQSHPSKQALAWRLPNRETTNRLNAVAFAKQDSS